MNLNFRQQSVGETTYLVLDIDDHILIDSFAMNMMLHNPIANIVQTQIIQINDNKQAQFNITALTKLSNRMATVRPKKEVLLIFNSILNAFAGYGSYSVGLGSYLSGRAGQLSVFVPSV